MIGAHSSLALLNANELTRRVFSSRISVRVIGGSAGWVPVLGSPRPAVEASGGGRGFLQIHAGGVDQFCRMTDLAAEPDRKARLRLRMRRHRPVHHLRDREVTR